MPRETIKEVLMRRDGNSEEEAEERIKEAKEAVEECDTLIDAEKVVSDHFGLEPDYLEELIG